MATTRPTTWSSTSSSASRPLMSAPRRSRPSTPSRAAGSTPPIPGNVTTKGVVVGDFEGTAAASGLLPPGSRPATAIRRPQTASSSLPAAPTSSASGQVVRVTGFARERFNQTTLNGSNSNARRCRRRTSSTAAPAQRRPDRRDAARSPTSTTPERYEGMLVRFPQSLVISEYFNYDRFGEIVLALPLAGETRPFTGTAIDEPGAAANARTRRERLQPHHARRRPERAEPVRPASSERPPVLARATASAAATP